MFKKKFPSLSSLGSDGNTAFLRAARAGHLDKVLEHLKSNIDINTSNSNGLNALHLASKDGHVNVVTELLKRGAVVDAATKKGNTALHIASLAGQEEVVKLLVANGAAVNVQSQNGFTPLYMAAQENHDNVVRFLLANGANQSLATEDGFTPLAVAMQQGHDKVVAVLLENDTRGKVRLPALHIAAKKDDCKAAALLLQNDHNPDVTSKSGFTPLHIAAHYGNESIANLLLNRGADVNYSAKHNITPLHVAAKWGKTNMVSLLLEKGANIESKTRDGLTPLHCAARSGHEQVVDMMLERGAPISSKTKNGLAPLHMASQGDHVDAARILLYHRAPVDEVTVDYLTALHVAAHCGHVRVAKLLLDRKADPNARALNGFTPLHIACKKNRIKVVELLLKHGASIEATTESGLTPLHVASFMGCMNIVIYLLQHDASPDVPTVRGETPLHLAARANQTDIIRILLRNGAQVDARAREQQTPLHIASRLGNVDIVMLLLQHGAAVDSTTKDMYTALHIAGKEGQEEVASVLLEHGASLTATTKKGFTPLHLAAKYGNMKVAKLLLQRDAPVDAQGKNGVTPLHVASHYDHQNVALLLLDKGASPHATAKNGHTPLHIAARKNQMDIATTLLEYGAKANAESKAGFTPLHLSSQEGHTDMSTLLIEHQADTNHKAKNGLTPLHLCAQEDRVNVASILVKNGAEVDSTTKAGYTPLHVASHFGQINMVRFLLQHGADVKASTSIGYTPLHQAAQQGHTTIVNLLLENSAPPNSLTNQGQTALSIAQKLGYISVVETLKVVTEPSIPSNVAPGTEEKYRVVAPETMQETFMSDSEDEGGEDTMLSDQPYRYLTVDEMKSLGDDSLPIDVTRDERIDSNRECMAVDDTISPQHAKESYTQFTATNYTPDNIDINRHPVHVGFLVSFLVDARGGAMRGCRHSGVRVIVPPRKATMPMRVTCRYLKRDKLSHPPPLMEGEALASRILELGPVGAKFLGPVIIEVPHFGSLRGMEREIVILRSDNGETWREHTLEASEDAVHEVLNESFEGEELTALEESSSGRMTRILTTDFPQYFAVVSRIRQEVHAIGPEGGMVSSSVVPQVQAVFPQGALTKKIKVGLQAQPIAAELAAKLLGNRVAVSPIVTVEPRRRKFHKPITLTIPVPQAANKGMINQYSGDAPTLRLLCSITGGTTRAQWEDVTGSTPLTFVNDCVSFTTTVSARFWLMDCRNIGEATKMATELYKEAIHVPFMAKFVVFAKRVDVLEARLRVFCMTDDKEDKTLEHQEHFTEVAKSRDVEVLEGKSQYIEFAGNLVPVTKSGDQLQLGFRAFRENRLPFTVRVKDPHADTVGRILFMREPKVAKGEPPQQPICILNIVLPETILPDSTLSEPDLLVLHKKYSFLRDGGLGRFDTTYQRTDLRLSDISNLLGEDWVPLASELGITTSDVNLVKSECPSSVAQQAMAMLRLWLQQAGNKATGNVLETALRKIGRDDIVQQCIFNVDEMDRAVAKVQLDQSGFESLKEELGPSRDASLRRDASLDIAYDEQDIMKESESVEELVQAEKKEPYEDRLPKPAAVKDRQERDIEETKYLGEEKVVEEERKTVAQLKEIFAQDKRDRQYERQPPVSEQLPVTPPAKPRKEKVLPPSISEDISKVSSMTEDSIHATIEEVFQVSKTTIEDVTSTIEEDISKKQPSSPQPSVRTEADQRRDSELFQGVSEELVRLETTYKVIPAKEELMSPKVSKTPPPSPAEFRDTSGTTTWQQGDVVTTTEQQSPAQEWTKKSQERDKQSVITKSERTRPLTAELTDRQEPRVEEPLTLHPTPSPRQVPKSESRTDTTSDLHTSPEEPVAPGISGEVSPVSHISVHRVSVGISPSEAVKGLEDKTAKEKPDEGKAIEEDVQSYSDRKKFWEQMTTSQTRTSVDTVIKQRTLSQESAAPPVPKPRASIPSPAPLISVLQESGIVKSETESDTETTTFSDSTIRMHPPPTSVSKQSTFTGSSDTSDREGSETEAMDIAATQITGVPTTATSAVTAFTQAQSHTEEGEGGSSDSEAEYLAKCADKPLAYDNTAFVGDDDSKPPSHIESLEDSEEIPPIVDKRALFEKSLEPVPVAKKVYERSVSLPTEELVPFDHNGSVRAKKRYFEAQIKKEMVVEQLMTQLEEEASPEHKSIHQVAAKQAADQERMVSRQIHSDIFSHELEENIDSLVPEDKDILATKEIPTSVKDIAKEFQQQLSTEAVKVTTDFVKSDDVPGKTVKSEIVEMREIDVGEMKKVESKVSSVRELAKGFEKETVPTVTKVIEDVKTDVTKNKDVKPEKTEGKDTAQSFVKEIQEVTAELQEEDYDKKKGVREMRSVFEGKYSEELIEKEGIDILTEKEMDVDPDLPSGEQEEDMSDQLAEVMHYKTEIITKPSDSLEVHVDKSEIEETEKERDIDEDIKAMESRADEDVIPSITVTLSGKQRTESYSQGESEDTQSESDVTPEEHPLYQPEEHIHDTVWEVPIQEQPESLVEEIVHEIPIERQVIVEKDEEEESEKEDSEDVKLSQEEARIIAEEVVDSIEAEVAKRAELMTDTVSPPVPPPELAESQVTEYLRQLVGKEELEPREVQLMESVLASKHREEMKRLSRTDTTTSSMEITDEDLRSSGVETDLSPLDSQAGRLHERTLSDDTQHDEVGIKLQGEEVVEKTLAEVRESLEAAQEQLIEQHKKKEEIVQKKESPSEFEFKVLTFEKTLDESIEESRYEEASATADYAEAGKDGTTISHVTNAAMKQKNDIAGETKIVVKEEIHLGKEGFREKIDITEELSEERESKTRESKFEDVATMKKDEDIVGEKRTSATFSDEEEHLLLSTVSEKEITGADGSTKAVKIAEEKECIGAVSEEKLVIESKVEDEHEGSIFAKEDVTRAQIATTKLEEKATKVEESSEEGLRRTEVTGQTDSRSEVVVEKLSTSKVVDHVKDDELETYHTSEVSKSEQKTEEAVKTERKIEVKKSFKVDTVPLDMDQMMPTLTEGIELSNEGVKFAEGVEVTREGVKFAEKEEIRRTSSEESQRSFSQDESTKSPIDSSSSSGRHIETETVRVVERPDGSEATVVVMRHPRQPKPGDAESSSSGERSGSSTLRADRRSGADFEAWSSSGESHYHSFEQTSESGRTYSRPCSSDVEALMAGVGTAGSSEYESAFTSQEISTRSTSHDYHTAVSSLSSRDSMKSLDSESSGHLASIEVSSEASETLVPSALELEKDMEGATGALVMDDDDLERREMASSRPPVIEEVVEPYDTAIPVHVIRGESPPQQYQTHTRTGSYISDVAGSSDLDMSGVERGEPSQLEDGRQSPFEMISESEVLEYPGEEVAVSEDEELDILESKEVGTIQTLSTDDSGSEERPHCMKRSHEMIFQPEPRPIITDSPLSETGTEERFGSSVEEGSILSVSLSSTSEASGLRTVLELSRADSERMDASVTSEQLTVSGTSEQLSSLDDIDTATITGTQFVDSGTCTYPSSTSRRELHLSSVTITTSSVDEYGVQSVCTQVTSQSHTPVPEDDEDHEDDDSQRETTNRMSGHDFPQSNGPTQVEYVPEYDDEYDDSRKRHMGHRRKESTSSFVPSMLPTMTSATPSQVVRPIPELSPIKVDIEEDMAESDKYTDTGPLTLKEVRSDEKKDVDEAERLEEESYQTEADQGFHRDLREGRVLLEDVAGIEEDPEAELDSSRPQSQVSKSDSEGHRPMSSGFSDDHPDSELAELLKQCSDGGKDLEDPIERPLSPEPADECEIKDDTPEFSSEAQASVTELEMEYSGAFSRSVEYASHVSPIREERTGIQYDEACGVIEHPSDHEDEMAEAEAAFQMAPHIHPVMPASLPATIPEDPAAEKHELETRDRYLKESKKHQETMATSPGSIPDITVTQHMTPLVDRGFHYPDLELEEEATAAGKSAPQTPASVSSRASSETETDQGREYVLEEEERDDYIGEEPELEEVQEDKHTESRSVDEFSAAEDKTVYESEVKTQQEEIKPEAEVEPPSPTTESPESDSFEMLEKPDLTDEYVVIEEVGKEAEEHDTEGKSVQITKKTRVVKKKRETSEEEELISSPPAPATRMTELKYYPEPGEDMGPFPFDSDSPPTAAATKKSVGVRAREYGYEGEEGEYDRDVEAGKKWIEMQFQGDAAAAAAAVGYGYEMEFERGPLEDIKEEEINDFDQSSSKVGSMGSYKGSIGSFGSVKESLSSTPEYDVLAGRKFFTRSGEHDDVSMSSLQEFEQLERQIAIDAARKRSHGSQDSLNGNNKHYNNSRSGQGDDVSLSSLKEFEGLETACIEAAKIETRAKEEETLLSEIEEGHESQVSESESCETMSVGDARGILGGGGESVDSDDYEKRMFEIDEIIRQAQSNVERFIDPKDDVTESVGRGDSLEEVARVPELDLDQPLYPFASKMGAGWREAGDDVMRTSSDSLESKDKSNALHASTDSLDLKTVADAMTTSADSIELQMQLSGRGDVMTDSIEMPADSAMMATSTDSLDLGGGPATGVTAMTDSIEEEEEMSMLGQGEGQGSGSGGQDQSSSSGREGDLSSSGKDDNSAEHGRVPPPRSDIMLGSTDSLEPSSSTATHATYQYETDSIMSSSFTSGGSNTMVSSTDTLDPTGAVAGGLDTIDLAAAARQAGVWFDETDGSAGKPFVTEVIEPSEEDDYSHTIRRTVELPPEIRKVSFKGPDAEKALREYVERFAPGEDVTETQEVDSEGNVHIKRVVQRRVVVRSEDLGEMELTGPELEEYLKHVATGDYEAASGEDVPESDYAHLMTSITGGAESFSSPPEHHTYVTRHMIPPTPGAVVTSTTQQGLTTTTPNLTGDLVLSDWEQHQSVSREEPRVQREEGEAAGPGESVRQTQTTQTRVVDGGKVTTTTTTTTTTKIRKVSGDGSDAEKKPE